MSASAPDAAAAGNTNPLLTIEGVCQKFSNGPDINHVLDGITFTAERSETICILGPSGCGKSTILRIVSGMYERYIKMPTSWPCAHSRSGSHRPSGRSVDGFPASCSEGLAEREKNIALPFQVCIVGPEDIPQRTGRARQGSPRCRGPFRLCQFAAAAAFRRNAAARFTGGPPGSAARHTLYG